MKSFLKCVATGVAVVLVFCIVITTVLLRSSQEVQANVSFEGINNIISQNSEVNPFTIYELVPDSSMSEIGYMIDGQEPIDWKSELKNIANSISRKNYMTDLYSLYSSIAAEDNTRPLTYSAYDESYEAKEGWQSYNLTSPDKIPAGTTGYGMIENIGAGDYTLSFSYTVNETQTGMYDENVKHYQYDANGGYYGIKFVQAPLAIDDETGALLPRDEDGNQLTLYQVVDTSAIITQEIFDQIARNTPNAYVYRVSRDYLLGAFDLVGRISDSTLSFSDFDENYIYYTARFEYIGDDAELSESTVYYTAEVNEFYNEKTGEYSGVLDASQPYIEKTETAEDGTVTNTGHFDMNTGETHYEYIGDGNGQYDLRIGNEEDVLTDPLYLSTVYYTGGFTNNNWFKNGVFNQDSFLSDNARDMYFDVKTFIPSEFNSCPVAAANLLYISANAFHNNGDEVTSFSAENDISWQQLCNIMTLVQSSTHLPVIVDYSIIGTGINDLAHATNLQKLVAILSSQAVWATTFSSETTVDAIDWNAIKNAINTDADHHFVNKNIYVFPGNSDSKTPFIMMDSTSGSVQYFGTPFIEYTRTFNDVTAFENAAEAVGFGEIAESIDSQNLSRRTENEALGENTYGYFDLKISKAIITEYILTYKDENNQNQVSNTLSVLDIEPCYVMDDTQDAIQKATIESWFRGREVPQIKVTHMSTAEFIGNIVDISSYDMVYIGMSVRNFETNRGETVYNDSRMNGMIYVNVGDIAVLPTDHTGMLENDYTHDGRGNRTGVVALGNDNRYTNSMDVYTNAINSYRYSGNDITAEKMQDLREYVLAGYPLIVADKFYNNPSTMDSVNQHYVDNCSYMYELFNGTYDLQGNELAKGLNKYTNVMTMTQVGENFRNLYNYLSLGKPQINLNESNLVIVPDTKYVKLNTNSISLDFSISNHGSADANATFNATLYLDSNADGKFSNTQEGINANDIRIYDNGELVLPTVSLDENGEMIWAYNLLAGYEHSYRLAYTLPENYVGIIPWRLKVSQSTNAYRYDLKNGYFFYKKNENSVEHVKILQIGSSNATNFNMETDARNANSAFARLLSQVNDYELEITYRSSNDFGNLCAGKDVKFFEDNYDMIIMGFNDMYAITDRNNSIQIIKDYINNGNPILFTHDTTSFYNNSTDAGKWGYYFNSQIRNLVGMDRYGVLENDALKVGLTLQKGSRTNTTVANRNYNIGALYDQAITYANANQHDLAYQPGSNKTIITRQNQGDSSGDMIRYARNNGAYNHYYYWKGANVGYSMYSEDVNQVNEGQITSYPFIIPENFTVSRTHAQYYQLDMNEDGDNDGESDIVVWYTLTNGNVYGTSPKDVRNNYYIYTKGNVTYSGVGHSGIGSSEAELKLYINTMIAAYKAGTHAPTIEIKKSDEVNADILNTIYETFDQQIDDAGAVVSDEDSVEQQVAQNNGEENAYEQIYFTPTDTNIVRNLKRKELRVDFCMPVDIEEYNNLREDERVSVSDLSGNPIYLKKINIDTYKKNGDGTYEQMITYYTSGVTYRADIPLSLLESSKNYVEIYAVAYTNIVRSKNDGSGEIAQKTSLNYSTFRIQKVGLTNLD